MTPTQTNEGAPASGHAATTALTCPFCDASFEYVSFDGDVIFYCPYCDETWEEDDLKELQSEFLCAEGVKAIQ